MKQVITIPPEANIQTPTPRLLDADSVGPLSKGNGALHHMGFVVPSILAVAEQFSMFLSARWDGQIKHDPLQQVHVSFFTPVDPRNPVFELVEPASETSPVNYFLKKHRGGLHHVCYEIDDLESGLKEAKKADLVVASLPMPAVAFGGRKIAWVCSKKLLLMELLERPRSEIRVRRDVMSYAHTHP